jgi:DNA repair exonuclease SbcCD ATPase subunit
LGGELCPTCGKPWDDADQRRTKKDQITASIKRWKSERNRLAQEYADLEQQNEQYESLRGDLNSAELEFSRLRNTTEARKAERRHLLATIKDEEGRENPFEEQILKEKLYLQELHDAITDLENEKVALLEQHKYYILLMKMCSKSGIQSYIAENYFGVLMAEANEYLNILDPNMNVYISPVRRLKSGELKEEIDVQIRFNDKILPYQALSDGQRTRVNISLLFAMHSLSSSRSVGAFDVVFLDEILDLSLDEQGQESVIALLKRLQFEKGVEKMLIISHNDGIKSSFPDMREVIMTSEGSAFANEIN